MGKGKPAQLKTLRRLLESEERPDLLASLEDEENLRELVGDPADPPDELPAAEAEGVAAT